VAIGVLQTDAMGERSLAAAAHENLIAAFAYVARRRPGGFSRSEGGVVTTVSGVALPLFNQVVVEGEQAAPEALADAVERVRAAGAPWLALLRDGTDDRFVAVLSELGLRELDERLPAMALSPVEEPPPAPAELDVRRARDRADVEAHALVNAVAAEVDPALLGFLADVGFERQPDAPVIVGSLDGQAVTTAMGFRTGATIGIYSVATRLDARRRGYGAAMTREVLRAGRAMGCDIAILQSSTMAVGLYESLGFRTVLRYRCFAPRDAGEAR
jgi:ribosomal protein S18 acetylase RimI-like enzyme